MACPSSRTSPAPSAAATKPCQSGGDGVTATPASRQTFIAQNLALAPVPGVPEIQLYSTHPGSGLWRLAAEDDDADPPYWAYPWGGGIVLARHLLDHPQKVRGARVLDLGCGGGVVGIAAALAGAKSVLS